MYLLAYLRFVVFSFYSRLYLFIRNCVLISILLRSVFVTDYKDFRNAAVFVFSEEVHLLRMMNQFEFALKRMVLSMAGSLNKHNLTLFFKFLWGIVYWLAAVMVIWDLLTANAFAIILLIIKLLMGDDALLKYVQNFSERINLLLM